MLSGERLLPRRRRTKHKQTTIKFRYERMIRLVVKLIKAAVAPKQERLTAKEALEHAWCVQEVSARPQISDTGVSAVEVPIPPDDTEARKSLRQYQAGG